MIVMMIIIIMMMKMVMMIIIMMMKMVMTMIMINNCDYDDCGDNDNDVADDNTQLSCSIPVS